MHGDVNHKGDSVSFTFTLNESKSWDFAEAMAEGGGVGGVSGEGEAGGWRVDDGRERKLERA